jgi:hypothetical protein
MAPIRTRIDIDDERNFNPDRLMLLAVNAPSLDTRMGIVYVAITK